MTIGDVLIPNLIQKAEELFELYPEYALDMERALSECPRMIENYNLILCSIAYALIYENEVRFEKAQAAYISTYKKFMNLGLCYKEQGEGD